MSVQRFDKCPNNINIKLISKWNYIHALPFLRQDYRNKFYFQRDVN